MTNRLMMPGAVALLFGLAACYPYNPAGRAVGGATLGAGAGTAIGSAAAGGTGAALGATVGAGTGAVVGAPPPPPGYYR